MTEIVIENYSFDENNSDHIKEVKKIIYDYFNEYGRDLPWRNTFDPYQILVSEMMLQQTQVSRVLPKWQHWLFLFPTVHSLANASLSNVLEAWSGLGYNRRAKYLYETAKTVVNEYNGIFPNDITILETFPGIGSYTARAVSTFAFNTPNVFIETNIRRLVIYFFHLQKEKVHDKEIIPIVRKLLDYENPRTWYYAMMDYGSSIAQYIENPNKKSFHYVKQKSFKGSKRKIRGQIIRELLACKKATFSDLENKTECYGENLYEILAKLKIDGMVAEEDSIYTLP